MPRFRSNLLKELRREIKEKEEGTERKKRTGPRVTIEVDDDTPDATPPPPPVKESPLVPRPESQQIDAFGNSAVDRKLHDAHDKMELDRHFDTPSVLSPQSKTRFQAFKRILNTDDNDNTPSTPMPLSPESRKLLEQLKNVVAGFEGMS